MSKFIVAFIVATAAVVVGLFAYLGSFARLMADDYCSIYFVQRLGVLRSVWFWYLNWHGGFSASFADGLLGLVGRHLLSYASPLTLVVWVFTLTWAIGSVFRCLKLRFQESVAIALSLLVMFGTLLVSPTPSASLIWWGGLRGYAPPLILATTYVAVYIWFREREHVTTRRPIWYALSFGMLFISGGFSEPFTPLQVIIVFLMLLVELYNDGGFARNPRTIFLSAGMLGSVVALVIMILAPGNAIRQGFYPAPRLPLEILSIGVQSYLSFFARIAHDFPKVVTAIAVFASSMVLGTFSSESRFFTIKNLMVVLILGLLLAFCSFLPAAYGQSSEPSDTSLLTPVYVLMIVLCTLGVISGGMLGQALQTRRAVYAIVPVLLALLSLGSATAVSTQRLVDEIAYASAYAANSDHRELQIRRARQSGLQKIFVPPIPRWITQEPSDNPKFFVNSCMSLYYGINILSSPDANEEPYSR